MLPYDQEAAAAAAAIIKWHRC